MSRQRQGLVFLLHMVIVVSLVLLGFGTAESAPAPKAPERVVFFSNPPGTSVYAAAVAVSKLCNKYGNLNTIVQPYPSPKTTWELLHKGDIDLALAAASAAYSYTYGISTPTQPDPKPPTPEVRLIMGANNLYFDWITKPDTGIKTIPDLKGRKLTGMVPGQSSLSVLFTETLRAYGLDKKDYQYFPTDTLTASIDALIDGKVDATFCGSIGPGAKMEELGTTKGCVIIPFPPEKRQFIPEPQELIKIRTLPAKYFSYMKEPVSIIAHQQFLVGREGLSDDTVYAITKSILAHLSDLEGIPDMKEWGREAALPADFFLPYHTGAIKYYKEQGMWTPTLEARQKEMMEKIAKLPKSK